LGKTSGFGKVRGWINKRRAELKEGKLKELLWIQGDTDTRLGQEEREGTKGDRSPP